MGLVILVLFLLSLGFVGHGLLRKNRRTLKFGGFLAFVMLCIMAWLSF